MLAKGRNRIYEKVKPGGGNGAALAHAELEALQALDFEAIDPHGCTLYTTTEPCPMCMGAFYMSGVRTLHFAARDPFAGSTNLLGKTWYMSRKTIKVSGPETELEGVIVALFAEQEIHFHNNALPENLFWEMYREAMPGVFEFAMQLAESGLLQNLKKQQVPAAQGMDCLFSQVKSKGRGFHPAEMEDHV